MTEDAGNRRAFLDLIGRVIHTQDKEAADPDKGGVTSDDGPRVIIP